MKSIEIKNLVVGESYYDINNKNTGELLEFVGFSNIGDPMFKYNPESKYGKDPQTRNILFPESGAPFYK